MPRDREGCQVSSPGLFFGSGEGAQISQNFGGVKNMYILVYGCFQQWGYPTMDGFLMENPIKMDDLWVPLFSETSIYIYIIFTYSYDQVVFYEEQVLLECDQNLNQKPDFQSTLKLTRSAFKTLMFPSNSKIQRVTWKTCNFKRSETSGFLATQILLYVHPEPWGR